MKNNLAFAFAALLLINVGCKKAEKMEEKTSTETAAPASNGGKVATQDDFDANKMGDHSYTYKATDGTRAGVQFSNSETNHTITVEANSKKFQLDRKETTAAGAKYERNGISAQLHGDSVTVTQGNNIIELVRDK